MALFLIPHWNGAILQTVSFSATGDETGIMLSPVDDPVLVMSFNHYPIISHIMVVSNVTVWVACAQIQLRYPA